MQGPAEAAGGAQKSAEIKQTVGLQMFCLPAPGAHLNGLRRRRTEAHLDLGAAKALGVGSGGDGCESIGPCAELMRKL